MSAVLWKKWTEVYSSCVSPITSTQFMEKGQLTPDEFVGAGDVLVTRCPTWKWHGAKPGTENVHKTMPNDKRYLVMSGARCEKRASDLTGDGGGEEDIGDGWTNTHIDHKPVMPEEAPDMDAPTAQPTAETDPDDIPDMSMDCDGGGIIEDDEDPSAVTTEHIVKCRKYDVHVLYDNYEYTPRVYLQGYDENDQRLTSEQMYEDIYTDYKEKTATIETHPYTGASMVSIHPCRHAETMKRMVDRLQEAHEARLASLGAEASSAEKFGISPDMAMFLFLKFISSVIPTIDYDYTASVNLSS